jgi:hypothetical protein
MQTVDESCLKSRKEIFFVLLTAAIMIFIRETDALTNPQFWAEDGKIFFLEQYKQGISAVINTYAGYLHLVPRLVALLAGVFFPYSAAPYVYNYSSFIIIMLVIANIYSPRFNYGPKWLLALTIVMVPHFGHEVGVYNVNLQWVLCVLLVTNYLKEPPSERFGNVTFQATSDVVQTILAGLTGPFIIFLLPFYLWRFLKERNRYRFGVLCVAVMASSIQAAFILTSKSPVIDLHQADPGWTVWIQVIGIRLFGNLFLPGTLAMKVFEWNHYVLFCFFISVIGLIFYKVVRTMENAHAISVLIFISLCILISALLKNRHILDQFIDVFGIAGPRYFYTPFVLITWAMTLSIGKTRIWTNYAIKILLLAICVASLSYFRVPPMADFKWSRYSKLIGKNKNLIIPINPPGWGIEMK